MRVGRTRTRSKRRKVMVIREIKVYLAGVNSTHNVVTQGG